MLEVHPNPWVYIHVQNCVGTPHTKQPTIQYQKQSVIRVAEFQCPHPDSLSVAQVNQFHWEPKKN